jgi:hypothetical protein
VRVIQETVKRMRFFRHVGRKVCGVCEGGDGWAASTSSDEVVGEAGSDGPFGGESVGYGCDEERGLRVLRQPSLRAR